MADPCWESPVQLVMAAAPARACQQELANHVMEKVVLKGVESLKLGSESNIGMVKAKGAAEGTHSSEVVQLMPN